jgi:O-antigen/teichoic acid export membrane protein
VAVLARLSQPLLDLIRRLLAHPLVRRVIRNSGYLLSASTFAAILSMGQSALSARILGVAGFGLLGTVTQLAAVVNGLTSFRMGQLVVSYVSEFNAKDQPRHAAAVFKAAGLAEIASSLVAYGLLLVCAPLAARYLAPHDPGNSGLYVLYGLMILGNLMAESSTGLLQVFNRFGLLAGITVGQSALTLLLITAFFFTGGGLQQVLIAYLVGKVAWALATTAAALVEARRRWGAGWWRSPFSLLTDRRRELVRFAVNTNVTTSLNLVTRDSEILWLSAFSTPEQVGYYKLALAIRTLLINPVDPLITTTYREVTREVAHRHWADVRYLLRSGSLLSAAWTIPASLGVLILGPWLISGIWGPEFLPSYAILLILLVGVIVVNILYWNRNVLLPLGRPEYPTRVHLVAAVLKTLGVFVLVPRWGASGMAVLLSGFYATTSGVLVWKTVAELDRAEKAAPEALE